jgi:hypothetical protein
MGWKELLGRGESTVILPWTGGRTLMSGVRSWTIDGALPPEHGWYSFRASRRSIRLTSVDPAVPGNLDYRVRGYLVGDRMIPDEVGHGDRVCGEKVFLLEPGIDLFGRIIAGRTSESGPLVFESIDMPLGPEENVTSAFIDRLPDIGHVKGVTPGLEAAFRFETRKRVEGERRRAELERVRQEEEEQRRRDEERERLIRGFGDGASRRELARVDFHEAARRSLIVSNAELLDARPAHDGVMVVRFRLDGRRFECTCERDTMRIVDSGICLTAGDDDPNFEEGMKGDAFFTLESLPSVIREAERDGKLVVYRHVR